MCKFNMFITAVCFLFLIKDSLFFLQMLYDGKQIVGQAYK